MSWRDKSDCRVAVRLDRSLATAWDNIDHGDKYLPDPQTPKALAICEGCPVRDMCLRDALADESAEGIRAGYRFHEGKMSSAESQKMQRETGFKGRVKRGQGRNHVENYNV